MIYTEIPCFVGVKVRSETAAKRLCENFCHQLLRLTLTIKIRLSNIDWALNETAAHVWLHTSIWIKRWLKQFRVLNKTLDNVEHTNYLLKLHSDPSPARPETTSQKSVRPVQNNFKPKSIPAQTTLRWDPWAWPKCRSPVYSYILFCGFRIQSNSAKLEIILSIKKL